MIALRLLLVTLVACPMFTTSADAQTSGEDDAPVIVFESISPWVAPEGTWTARFRTNGVALNATITYSVRQTLDTNPETLIDHLNGLANGDDDVLTGPQQRPVSVPIADIIDSTGLVTLRVDVRDQRASDDDRLYLPRSGIHPVVLTVNDAAGTTLDEHTLFLNHLPADPRMPSNIALISSVVGGPVDGSDETPALSSNDREKLEELATLAEQFDEAPLNVSIDPELLAALASTGIPADTALLSRLAGALEDAQLIRQTWAPLDAEQWALSGARDEYAHSLDDGGKAIAAHLGQLPETDVSVNDVTVGPAAVQELNDLGVTRIVVGPGQGFETGRVSERFGSEIIPVDGALEDLLDGDQSPAVAAHVGLTMVFARWRRDSDTAPVALIRADERDGEVLAAFLEQLRNYPGGPFETTTLDGLFDEAPVSDSDASPDEWDLTDTPIPAPGIWEIADELRARSGAVNSLLGDGSEIATDISFQLNSILHRDLSESEQADRAIGTAAALDEVLNAFSTPDRRSVTVTSRETSIPIRITNDLDVPANVVVRFDSPRVQFEDGNVQQLTIAPGVNRLEIPVIVRSSGGFLLTFEVLTANEGELLTTGEVSIRSTAFSGVGLILSGGALVVLVVWWWRTLRNDDEDEDDENLRAPLDTSAAP